MQRIRVTKIGDKVNAYLKRGDNWVLLEEVIRLEGDFDIELQLEEDDFDIKFNKEVRNDRSRRCTKRDD